MVTTTAAKATQPRPQQSQRPGEEGEQRGEGEAGEKDGEGKRN